MFDELNSPSDIYGLPPEFLPKCPRNVPRNEAFHRIVERLRTEGTVHPLARRGTISTLDGGVHKVRNFFDDHPASYVHSAAQQLGMPLGKFRTILRRKIFNMVIMPSSPYHKCPSATWKPDRPYGFGSTWKMLVRQSRLD